jgi:hypothetical protein
MIVVRIPPVSAYVAGNGSFGVEMNLLRYKQTLTNIDSGAIRPLAMMSRPLAVY